MGSILCLVKCVGCSGLNLVTRQGVTGHRPIRSQQIWVSLTPIWRPSKDSCLRILRSKSYADSGLAEKLTLISRIWSERTDSRDPWLVFTNVSEALAMEAMCNALQVAWRVGNNRVSTSLTPTQDVGVSVAPSASTAASVPRICRIDCASRISPSEV